MNDVCPILSREGAIAILTTLRDAGFETYFAGGCVRDRLLSCAPTEYDIATAARPNDIQKIFPNSRSVGEAFGVMLVRANDIMYDVATFREDGPYSDARHPDTIQFCDAERDAKRRDFTINGMFEDPISDDIIDFVEGKQDMELRQIRAIGTPAERFAEDHLRMLRAIRFSSRLEFSIEPETAESIRELSHELAGVSRERIGEEIKQMLLDRNRGVAGWELQYLGLDRILFEEESCMNAPTRLGRLPEESSYATALAAWILDRYGSASDLNAIATQWQKQLLLSNRCFNELTSILQVHQVMFTWNTIGIAKQKRTASLPTFISALSLIQAEDRPLFIHIKQSVATLTRSGLAPERLVNGNDLLEAGIPPSSQLGDVLEAVYDAQLEGTIQTEEEAKYLALVIYRDLLGS